MLAIDAWQQLLSWGCSDRWQTGHKTREEVCTPKVVLDFVGVRMKGLSCGWSHSVVITSDDHVWSVGANSWGQCGVIGNLSGGSTLEEIITAKQLEDLQYFSQVVFFCPLDKQKNKEVGKVWQPKLKFVQCGP